MRFSGLGSFHKIQFVLFFLAFSTLSICDTVVAGGNVAVHSASTTAKTTPLAIATFTTKPLWTELSPQQKLALSPLSPEWDKMDETRKKKWLEIANKYPTMKPDEQARVQLRLREWVKLSPEQRMQARENFARTTQIKPELKSAQWQQYQQLSEDQKKQLASEASKKKSITNLPPEAQRNVKPLAPIRVGPATAKATPKPVPAQPLPIIQNLVPVTPLTESMAAPANTSASQAISK